MRNSSKLLQLQGLVFYDAGGWAFATFGDKLSHCPCDVAVSGDGRNCTEIAEIAITLHWEKTGQ